jgi:thioredoxin-related protein
MLRHARVLLLLLAVAGAPSLSYAIQHTGRLAAPRGSTALIVIEKAECFYCRLFRRDVGPAYAATPRARDVPMHYLDLEAAKARQLALARPIEVLPTVVLLQNGREIERIAGYMAPDNFVRVINYLLSRTP